MTTVRIWFTKTGEASYISLLDLQRVMQRSLKRSGLPVWYTLGFNPHIYMTFACPLPLGQESLVESVDVKTEVEQPDLEAWKAALEPVMPLGVSVTAVTLPQCKAEQIASAVYTVRLPAAFAQGLDRYNTLDAAPVLKKSKRGQKEIDLKEHCPRLDYTREGDEVRFEMTLPAGEGLNLNPSLWLGFLQEQCGVDATRAHVLRRRLLTKNSQDFA